MDAGNTQAIALIVFLATYAGVALGEIPGLALDRTGIALLGAVAMIGFGVLSAHDAMMAIDLPTILLLYSLMVVSSQFRLGGFYTHLALRITANLGRPRLFLLALMAVSAVLSAVLANDIVCLAFTPVVCAALLNAGLNPVPFLLGLAISSNIGSAATIIGNPQNMLIGQVGKLHFGGFIGWCAVPSLVSLALSYGILMVLYRREFHARPGPGEAVESRWPAFNPWQSIKGLAVTAALMGFFFTPVPREVSALCAAGLLLCSRKMGTRSLLGLVDWHLITLFAGLFIVIGGISATGLPARWVGALGAHGMDLGNPHVLTVVSAALSNLVSNVPATMLLVQFLDPAAPVPWYVLAVSSTFAGNLFIIGSIANLIVIEQAKQYGVTIRFRDHARAGVPVTLASLVVLALWICLAGG
jgi:Na+/H+ antiporter NhaD/arsenite permease-like protein